LVLQIYFTRVLTLKSAALPRPIGFKSLNLFNKSINFIKYDLAFIAHKQLAKLMPVPLVAHLFLHLLIQRSVLNDIESYLFNLHVEGEQVAYLHVSEQFHQLLEVGVIGADLLLDLGLTFFIYLLKSAVDGRRGLLLFGDVLDGAAATRLLDCA